MNINGISVSPFRIPAIISNNWVSLPVTVKLPWLQPGYHGYSQVTTERVLLLHQ